MSSEKDGDKSEDGSHVGFQDSSHVVFLNETDLSSVDEVLTVHLQSLMFFPAAAIT